MMMKKTSTTMIDFKLIFDREKEEKTFVKFHWIFDVFFSDKIFSLSFRLFFIIIIILLYILTC